MSSSGLLSSFTFRFLALYVAGLSLAVFLTLGAIYGFYSYNHFTDVNAEMVGELDAMESAYVEAGSVGLSAYIETQTRLGYFNKFFYLVVDNEFNKLSGNLAEWPSDAQSPGGWLSFELDMRDWGDSGSDVEFVALSRQFDDGVQVLAARHFEEVFSSSRLVWQTLIRTMLVTLLLVFWAGL